MQLSIFRIILYTLLPFGQLYARLRDFNGSLDKIYLLFPIFLVPPFSIIPILLMAFGFVAKGKGGSPYDHMMWIPILTRFFTAALVKHFIQNSTIASVVIILTSIVTILIPNLLRRNKECSIIKDSSGKQTFSLDSKQIFKSVANSIFELGFGYFFSLIFSFIPFVGIVFKLITFIPVIGTFVSDIVWAMGFATGYIIINILDQENMNTLCYPPTMSSSKEIFRIIFGVFFMIIGSIFSGGKLGKLKKLGKLAKLAKKSKSFKKYKKFKKYIPNQTTTTNDASDQTTTNDEETDAT